MSLTLLGWLLVASSIAISALLILPQRLTGSRRAELDQERCKVRLEDIGAQLKLGKLSEAEADAARLALLSPLRSSRLDFGRDLRGTVVTLILPVAGFLLVAGIGAVTSAVTSDVRDPPQATGSGDTNDEMLARVETYTRSIGAEKPAEEPASVAAEGKLLPDVNTMIERLAARLETTPEDLEGWRTLGWSYFHTGRYEQAAAAFGRAVKLDPSSAELKRSYEEAKAKAAGNGNSGTALSSQTAAVGKGGDTVIRSMVDGLAHRLESSPRDVEGWIRLMRSRVVLGEKDGAETVFRKALEVFKDDSSASDELTAAATELGLKE